MTRFPSRFRRRSYAWWHMLAAGAFAFAFAFASATVAPRAEAQPPDVPTVAAASDLNAAVPEIARRFTEATGRRVTLVFGSSGAFAQQIQNGAPYQLFLSADEAYVTRLVGLGRTEGTGSLYATGRIGLFLPRHSRINTDTSLRGFVEAVHRGAFAKFAIANPVHAPYGRAAREALESLGIWNALQPRLVLGENVSQATQFAMSGSAQGGIIPLSLARTPAVQRAGTFVLIGEGRHRPLRQRLVLLKGAGTTARAFERFLQSAEARAVFEAYGFGLPAAPGAPGRTAPPPRLVPPRPGL
jgi:molybdate transport system substrate-binding protein